MKNGRKVIVMVDDNITNLNVAKNALMEHYDVFTVPSGKKLFKLLKGTTPDLILLDVDMPEMNGYEVISILKRKRSTAHIPIIFLTALADVEAELTGLNLGAIDYIRKPFSAPLLLKRIEVHLLVETQKKALEVYNTNLEQLVNRKTKAIFELQNVVLKTVAELVEFRDDITGRHIERTQDYLRVLVDNLLKHGVYAEEISSWNIKLFLLSAQLHDVGKIAIKDSILLKSTSLTREEFEEIKEHTVIGARIIKKIATSTKESAFLRHAEILALSHHEKWDGTGYPAGLKGDAIPLQGRLMAIVDVYDALTNERPYKKAFSHEEALEIIRNGIGTQFDPQVASMFLQYAKNIKNAALLEDNFPDTAKEKTEAAHELRLMFSKTLEEIQDYREGINTENNTGNRIRSYMNILINALSANDKYKDLLASWDIELFNLSTKLYDVGKMAVNDEILHKVDNLTQEEFEKIKEHTDCGVKIVKRIQDDIGENVFLEHAKALIGSHHEKWDGTGYPLGLKEEEIPLQGRLMAIIDVYDALTSGRPYKKASSHEEAVAVIKQESGTRFDPHLVKIFLEHEDKFNEITMLGHNPV